MKAILAFLASTALSMPAMAAPPVRVDIADLGTPLCAALNPTPDFLRGYLGGDLFGNATPYDPWLRWPIFAGHSSYSAVYAPGGTSANALYRFATPQTAVTFVVGAPQSFNKFVFWQGDIAIAEISGSDIVAALGATPHSDYYVRLSLDKASFDAFSFEIAGAPTYAYSAYANFDRKCP